MNYEIKTITFERLEETEIIEYKKMMERKIKSFNNESKDFKLSYCIDNNIWVHFTIEVNGKDENTFLEKINGTRDLFIIHMNNEIWELKKDFCLEAIGGRKKATTKKYWFIEEVMNDFLQNEAQKYF